MDDGVSQEDALAAVEGFTSAWLAHDIDRKATFLTDDFTLWNNCTRVDLAREAALAFFRRLTTVQRNNRYHDVRRLHAPFGIVQQHLTSFETDGGRFDDIPMLLVFHTRGRFVARCDEYVDSTGLPRLDW